MVLNQVDFRDSSRGSIMRHVRNPQMELGEIRIFHRDTVDSGH